MAEMQVAVPGGALAVQSFGGEGRDVLLVHSIGWSGMNLGLVAEPLADFCRPFSVDLPGHAHSTAPMRGGDDQWRHLGTVVRELGLQRPLLVGFDTGAWASMIAAANEPDLFAGMVLVGGPVARDREAAQEHFDFAQEPAFSQMLSERFLLGRTGTGEAEADAFADQAARQFAADWMLEGVDHDWLKRDTRYSIVAGPGGLWVHTPTVETVLAGTTYSPGATFPCEDLYAGISIPTWIVQLTEGFDANLLPRETELVAGNPHVTLRPLTSGQWAHFTAVSELTAVVQEAVASISTGALVRED